MLWFLVVATVGLVTGFLVWDHSRSDLPPKFGIYQQPGKWFYTKKICMYLLLRLRRLRRNRKSKKDAGKMEKDALSASAAHARGRAGYGFKSIEDESEMEKPQPLSEDPHALDSVYISGTNSDGTFIVMRIGRLHDRKCELWLSAFVPGLGPLQSPVHPDSLVHNTDGKTFTAGGLKLECLEAMRRWKFSFNGLLRKGYRYEWSEKDTSELVHTKFSFIWEAFTEKFDFDTDMSEALVADSIAREKWTRDFWTRLQGKHQTHYEQFGEMWGQIKVDGQSPVNLNLRGLRDHSYGVRNWESFHRYIVHIGHLKDGTVFHVSNISMPETTSFISVGYVVLPCAAQHAITWTNLDLSVLAEDEKLPETYNFSFTAGGKTYDAKVTNQHTPWYYMRDDWCSKVYERMCKFSINGVDGQGIAECCYRYKGGSPIPARQSLPMLGEPEVITEQDRSAITLTFRQPVCCSSALVGGKGCQLASLTQMSSKDFMVPQGFCLTIAAFTQQLEESPHLLAAISQLEAIASGRAEGDLRNSCEKLVEQFETIDICLKVKQAINEQFKVMEPQTPEVTFAVRSSAAGEDGEEMSGAGQMDTILGVKGPEAIFKAVCKCWASHFAFMAVEYRRQHGQPIRSSMAVVIQQMVKAEVAGVLFTRDPLTGNPSYMSLNANYGLGESVVSGSSDPDAITLSRTHGDGVKIIKKVIGRKETQIKIKEDGGTEECKVTETETQRCSLSDDIIINLANIGIELEQRFSNPRDIEFAVCGSTIYLLQARPITTLDPETEWEMMHEFDTPLASDNEVMTTANIGEMMPGAMTPLTSTVFFRAIDYGFQDMLRRVGLFETPAYNIHKLMGIRQGKPFINMMYLYGLSEQHVLGNDKRMADLALMGEVLEEVSVQMVEAYWGRSPLHRQITNGIRSFLNMRDSARRTQQWEDKIPGYSLGEHKMAAPLYAAITAHMDDLYQCWADTFANSSRSGAWGTILMAIISQGKHEWTTQYYSDVAMLLAKCDDVYSADVPSALQEMAIAIYESGQREHFINMTPEEAAEWLQLPQSGEVGFRFSKFLRFHGHRCVREADFYEKSWRAAPTKVVTVLQTMLASSAKPPSLDRRAQTPAGEAINQIKSPVTMLGRFILKWALPKARKAVGSREWGKSISIEFNDIFKEAYWKLAKLMVAEGFLPEEELVFFLTHNEIGKLITDRSARLVARAQRRRRLFEKQTNQSFDRINWGHPVPIEETRGDADDFIITSVTLKGMPVSQGQVKGTAKVVLSLKDADSIKPGDVLIVPYTDVGWSPYFPLISGLVTEIGGLLSHGAVVAREYGIPCVVNVQRATHMFKSGDRVLLDGFNGILEKIE